MFFLERVTKHSQEKDITVCPRGKFDLSASAFNPLFKHLSDILDIQKITKVLTDS